MIFFRIKEYLRYFLVARHKNGHGIHSPFIFDVVSVVFRNKTDLNIVSQIETARKMLLSDDRLITVNDLGAGSVIIKNNKEKRKVSVIARYSSLPEKYCVLLSALAGKFGDPGILELGTSFGISTMYMAFSSGSGEINTIEGSEEVAEMAVRNFSENGLTNIKVHVGSFKEKLPLILSGSKAPGLVFIDGDHRKESLLGYFEAVADKAEDCTVVVIDDIYLSPEMKDAWLTIRKHKKVSVTIDIYRFGIVFFRRGINNNHFIVRH